MKDNVAHARGWFLKAESDLSAAQQVLASEGPYDTACFHAQQATEKFLKGFLAYKNAPIPHIHNIEDLVEQCNAADSTVNIHDADLAELTSYAVEMRYDFEFWPDIETASHAIEIVLKIQHTIYCVTSDALPKHPTSP